MTIRTSPGFAGLAAAGLVTALVATTAPVVPAAAADGGPVTFADTPSVTQAARAYPYLEGGVREGFRFRNVYGPVESCEIGTVTRARGGVTVGYRPATGGNRVVQPRVTLSRFTSPERARSVLDRLRTSYAGCRGTFGNRGGETVRSSTADPRLGAGSFGVRERERYDGGRTGSVTVLTVQGATLVRVEATRDGFDPDLDRVVTLARTTKQKLERHA